MVWKHYKPVQWWQPNIDEFDGRRCREMRFRWRVAIRELSDHSGVDFWILSKWDEGTRKGPVSDEFRQKVFYGLRDLVLMKARKFVLHLEQLPGADSPPPLAGLSTERSSLKDAPSFLLRNRQ